MRWVVLPVLVVSACAATDNPNAQRYENRSQGYSVAQPDGAWRETTDQGATMFIGTARARHTITLRSTARPMTLGELACNIDNVAATTKHVLLAMPNAKLVGELTPVGTELPARQFMLTYKPGRTKGKTYQRLDAVVVGEKHIFHVIYTAPASEPIDEQTFTEMVQTIREEA